MSDIEQNKDDMQAAICGDIVMIKISGRGSFKVAAPMKQFIAKTTTKRPIQTIVIDLEDCIGMDSTFMGVLAGLTGRLKKDGKALEVINLSQKNADLLKTLGVDQVVSSHKDSHGYDKLLGNAESIDPDSVNDKCFAKTALEAHKELVEIHDENAPRFEKVIELLKKDVDRLN